MISSVSLPLRCRAIYASDLLFLRKRSLVVPIHQNSSQLLSTLKKLDDQPLHMSTSVENLKFKCEAAVMSTVMKKKNITGAYLATRWAVPNVSVLNMKQQLNALALTLYPTLSIMTLNLSPGNGGYASGPSIRGFSSYFQQKTEVINKSDRDIAFLIKQPGEEPSVYINVKAGQIEHIKKQSFENIVGTHVDTTVLIRAGSKDQGRINPADFIDYEKLVFNIDGNGKLVGRGLLHKGWWNLGKKKKDQWENLVFYQVP